MTFSMMIIFPNRSNIRLFQQLSKRFVTPRKRRKNVFRSGIFLVFLVCTPVGAGFEDLTCSARLAALADAGVALPYGADCLTSNPAALFINTSFDAHLFYTRPFGLDISLGNCAVRYSHKRLAAGIGMQNFGNTIYQENQFITGAAARVLPTLILGAAVRYARLSIQHYGHAQSVMFDIGMIARLSPKVNWGFCLKNAGNAKIGVDREPLPSVLSTGLYLQPHSNVSLLCDVSKDTRFPLDVRCGVDYRVFQPLSLRAGVGNEPTRFSAGFALFFSRLRIDYAFSSHLELGATHLFSIGVF